MKVKLTREQALIPEYVTELKKDKRHAVEDAMSDALIRKCPSCRKPYIKETGSVHPFDGRHTVNENRC